MRGSRALYFAHSSHLPLQFLILLPVLKPSFLLQMFAVPNIERNNNVWCIAFHLRTETWFLSQHDWSSIRTNCWNYIPRKISEESIHIFIHIIYFSYCLWDAYKIKSFHLSWRLSQTQQAYQSALNWWRRSSTRNGVEFYVLEIRFETSWNKV